jgi:hypothetical protein
LRGAGTAFIGTIGTCREVPYDGIRRQRALEEPARIGRANAGPDDGQDVLSKIRE